MTKYVNPFKPGAGHFPPYLAGRLHETEEFKVLLKQKVILQNLILSGLRGIGKTVLLQRFKPIALQEGWLWSGQDCTEATSIDENAMVIRIITDLALVTSSVKVEASSSTLGFMPKGSRAEDELDFNYLIEFYKSVPGMPADKLKVLLTFVWDKLKPHDINGIIFAYDEAQSLSDHPEDKQYPLGVLLDVFQYLQRNGVPFMLILTGLPTLQARLVETKTFTERMFKVLTLDRLTHEESKDAIVKPIKTSGHPVGFTTTAINTIIEKAGGYPYFIQFICREAYDILDQHLTEGTLPTFPIDAIIRKLDNDFFAGRWAQATERERVLLTLVAKSGETEFTISKIVELSKKDRTIKPFSSSQASQMLSKLIDESLIYKNRRGSYSFAVPLLDQFILRFNQSRNQLR